MCFEQLLNRFTTGKLFQNQFHGDARAGNSGLPIITAGSEIIKDEPLLHPKFRLSRLQCSSNQ